MSYLARASHRQTLAALLSSGAFYPNATTVAEFRPNSLTLHFHHLSREFYSTIVSRPILDADRRHVEVVAHELTHWSDQISSVWGQEYLISLFDAYDAAERQLEEKFFRVVEHFDEERRVLLPLYYHVVEHNTRAHNVNMPWRISFSAGQEFGPDGRLNPARPIFFVIFGDSETAARVARQPITVGALLETTATWAEILAGLAALSSLSPDERTVEQRLWSSERLAPLYDPEVTVYTAPVHMLAHFTSTKNVPLAYERAAILASVALNLTEPLFHVLRHPDEFAPFGERKSAFISARSRGYAFAVLARHASVIDIEQPILQWLADLLQAAGLPSYQHVMHAAYTHLDALGRGLPVRSALDSVRDYLFEIGRARFLARTSAPFLNNVFDPLDGGVMPPMFDANAELFSVGSEHLDLQRFDPEEMHRAEWRLRSFTDNFLQGCRGLGVSWR